MRAIVLDTHAIIWYFLKSPKLSNAPLTAIDQKVLNLQMKILPILEIAVQERR